MNDRLYRSRTDRIIGGVAGGVAEMLAVDPSIVRIVWVILVPLTGGLMLLLYVIMLFIVPEEPAGNDRWDAWSQQGGWAAGAAEGPAGGTPPSSEPMAGEPPPWGPQAQVPASAPGAPASFAPPATGSSAPATGSSAPATTAAAPTASAGEPVLPPEGTPDASTLPPAGPASPAPIPPPGTGAPVPPGDWRGLRQAERATRRAERQARRAERGGDIGVLVFGVLLILVGAYFLARAYIPSLDTGRILPVLLVVIGVAFLLGSVRRSGPLR